MNDSIGFFACFDSATIADKFYTFIEEQKEDCCLITSQTETLISHNFKKKVFYSPRIEYGVDLNIETKQNVYCNMNQLYLFCASKPYEPKYKDLESVNNELHQSNTINTNYLNVAITLTKMIT